MASNYQLAPNKVEEEWLEAIDRDPFNIRHVRVQTRTLCLAALTRNGNTIRYIRDKNNEYCEIAVKNNPLSLEFIPYPTFELCVMAANLNPTAGRFVNRNRLTSKEFYDFQMMIIRKSSMNLRHIVDPDREVIIRALENTGSALAFVKDPDEELCRIAVANWPWAIRYVKNQTPELQKLAYDKEPLTEPFFEKLNTSSNDTEKISQPDAIPTNEQTVHTLTRIQPDNSIDTMERIKKAREKRNGSEKLVGMLKHIISEDLNRAELNGTLDYNYVKRYKIKPEWIDSAHRGLVPLFEELDIVKEGQYLVVTIKQ